MATLKFAPDFFSRPALEATPGARKDHRVYAAPTGDLTSTTTIIALGILPAGHKLMGCALEVDSALDTNNLLTIDVGILNFYNVEGSSPSGNMVPSASNPAAYNSGNPAVSDTATAPEMVTGQKIFAASTVGRAGGRVSPSAAFTNIIGVDYNHDRVIGIQFPAAATAAVAGNIGLILDIDAA